MPQPILDKLAVLQELSSKQSFGDKKQFPGVLRASLRDCVWEAMDYRCHDDLLYKHLATVLPYSMIVIKKLVLKTVCPERIKTIKEEVENLYDDMEKRVKKSVAAQQLEEHQAAAAPNPESGDGSGIVTPASEAVVAQPPVTNNLMTPASDVSGYRTKFKWEEDLRALLWNILCTEWELAELNNFASELGAEKTKYIESAVRKAVYNKVILSLLDALF